MQQLLTGALDVAFFALVAITLIAYVRHPTPIARDTVLVFGSVGLVLALAPIDAIAQQLGWWTKLPVEVAAVSVVLFLAQPFLAIRLIQHFREGVGRVLFVAFVLFVASSAVILYATLYLTPTTGERLQPVVTMAVVGYFTGGNIAAALYFVDEARRRAGAARIRLTLAAIGSILFGTSILVAGAASATTAQQPASSQPQEPTVLSMVTLVLALLAGIAYLFAFVPPRFLRSFWQRTVAYDYLRDLVMDPEAEEHNVLWNRLAGAARQVTGARASAVAVGSYDQGAEIAATDGDWRGKPPVGLVLADADLRGIGPFNAIGRRLDNTGPTVRPLVERSGARRVGSIPIATDTGIQGILLLFMARTPLFVEDDLMLLDVLNAHTARAVEREKVLTERTALVSQLRLANDELAHASAAKSDFLAAMSHELRTPLHAIIGFSELLLTFPARADGEAGSATERSSDPNVKEFAGHIHGAGLHLLELINDVLDLAKVEAGRLDLMLQPFDISALLYRTARTMRPIAARKRVTLDIPEPIGIEIEADAARVRQIIFNLLSNAIKFTPAGGHVEVSVEVSGSEVRLTIADTGPGIAPEDQERIFEPFEQSWRRESPRVEGTGLGLALTRQLVEGHGGRVELASVVGLGSRFTVVLPRATGRTPISVADETTAIFAPPQQGDQALVMVVEDDPRAQELLSIYLREAGYNVAVVGDGVAAVAEVRRLRPAAVLLDVILPGLDGWEVLRELKAQPETIDTPVIIISVVDESEVGFALGAVDYLVKPVRRDTLLRELRRLSVINGEPVDGTTVLAIDDDTETLDLYRAELEPQGFRILTADNGEAGLRLAREYHPDAILLDLLMPGMDGYVVAEALLEDSATREIPIIVLTSGDVTAAERTFLHGNVRQVLHKGPDAALALLRWLRRVTGPHVTPAVRSTASSLPSAAREPEPAGVSGSSSDE